MKGSSLDQPNQSVMEQPGELHRRILSPAIRALAMATLCIAMLSGCVTREHFYRPDAAGARYQRENPSCPGPHAVAEFAMPGAEWVVLRVMARRTPMGEGTVLDVRMESWISMPEPPRTRWSMFPGAEEEAEQTRLMEARKARAIEVVADSPFATLVRADGSRTQGALPFFEAPYCANEVFAQTPARPFRSTLDTGALDGFSIELPVLRVNRVPFHVPVIAFRQDRERVVLVLNC